MIPLDLLSVVGTSQASSPPRQASSPPDSASSASVAEPCPTENIADHTSAPICAGDSSPGARRAQRVSEQTQREPPPNRQSQKTDQNGDMLDEKTPLLKQEEPHTAPGYSYSRSHSIAKRIAGAIIGTVRLIISAVLAPGRYLVACFYDDNGQFSAITPVYRISRKLRPKQMSGKEASMAVSNVPSQPNEKDQTQQHDTTRRRSSRSSRKMSVSSIASTASWSSLEEADEEQDRTNAEPDNDSPAKHTRSRSIRIKVASDEALRLRRQRRDLRDDSPSSLNPSKPGEPPLTVDSIKSPISPTSSSRITRYPRQPAPPRPLVPKRQPSYASKIPFTGALHPKKTLVIDLDETLIHSMAKGGRMSSGHMVEVKLSSPVGAGGQILGPQVPILYYVHKRPHCDEFLRKVSKWYNLVVFTASVQEYADPVIDWLEIERKYFSARYYRQHCTFRNGAYIKDLSSVEPDLSKVMILDNSPMSYIFHEDNAIPIEGWISDPSDNDLLHLVPFLEGLSHATDVRALLALRMGEASMSVAA